MWFTNGTFSPTSQKGIYRSEIEKSKLPNLISKLFIFVCTSDVRKKKKKKSKLQTNVPPTCVSVCKFDCSKCRW